MRCSSCGFTGVPAAAFCGGCGRPLAGDAAAGTASNSPAAPGVLIGERKLITVMFADIKGSLEMLEDSDPERSQALLDSVIDVMIDAVHRYGGTVNQVLGDGIMALFGAPMAHEDHALRGCCAALVMQDLVARSNAERHRRFGVEAQIRVGVHSGEVVVRPIDNDLALDYRAVGMTTHVAARLEKMARPGAVLLSGTTAALVEGYVRVEPLGLAPIKGLRDKVPIFELLAAFPVRSRFQVSVARGLSRLIGRQSELAALHAALDRAATGIRQVMALAGEPGVGKSRLCHELAVSRQAANWIKLQTGCSSHGQTAAYLPLLGLVRTYFEIDEHDTLETISAKIKTGLAALGSHLEPLAAILIPFVDARSDSPVWRKLDPLQRRKLAFEALRNLLIALTGSRPLLLIVEDLHWLDSGSRAFLDELLAAPSEVRMALVFTFRPEFQHDWGEQHDFAELTLTSLVATEAQALLRHLLGSHQSLQPVSRLLIERTQGNPFFMEEIVRSLAETGVLVGERGSHRLGGADAAIEVPATLEAVIAARVDRLPASAKDLLQAAAAIGKTSGIDLLRRVADVEPEPMYRDIQLLRDSGMLRDTQLFPSLEIGFAHALTHEVVYHMLLRSRRIALHDRVVQALESMLGDRVTEHVDRLADQAFRAELWDRAVAYHLLAGSRALVRSACREAVAIADRGLAATANLEDRAVRARAEVDLRLLLFTALLTLGELPRLVKTLGEAETLAESLGDTKRRTVVANQLAAALWMEGNHTRALSVGQRALSLAQSLADPALQVAAKFQLGFVYHALGEFERAIETHTALLPLLEGERERKRLGSVVYPSVGVRTFLGSSLIHVGDLDVAEQHLLDGRRIAAAIRHPHSQVMIDYSYGNLLLRRNDAAAAVEVFANALMLCRDNDVHTMLPAIVADLGLARAMNGEISAAIALLEDALRQKIYRTGGKYTWFFLLNAIGRAYLLAGRPVEALQRASEAEAVTLQSGEHAHHAYALKLLADVKARFSNVPAAAEQHYVEAMALAAPRGMRPLLADCHWGLAELHAAAGDERSVAEERLAVELYDAMGIMPPVHGGVAARTAGEARRQHGGG